MKKYTVTGLILILLAGAGCTKQPAPDAKNEDAVLLPAPAMAGTESTPSFDGNLDPGAAIPLFASNSPFDVNASSPPQAPEEKILWAKSCLYEKAPDLVVETWLTDKPETQGKCVLIEFWATWCPPCRKSIGLLNDLHQAYGKDLVVIGISDETEAAIRRLKAPAIDYYLAIDTQHRMKDQLKVTGVPHIIILEPGGYVVWEGFPYLKGYELTHKIVKTILQIAEEETP